jgi:hypothetical protein
MDVKLRSESPRGRAFDINREIPSLPLEKATQLPKLIVLSSPDNAINKKEFVLEDSHRPMMSADVIGFEKGKRMSPKLLTGKQADIRKGAAQYVPVQTNDERGNGVWMQQGPDFEIDPDET